MITRKDITSGYQVVQSAHAIADFIGDYPNEAKEWRENGNSIVCLSVKNEQELLDLCSKFDVPFVRFYEPDISEYTAICVLGTPKIRRKLSYLPLTLKGMAL